MSLILNGDGIVTGLAVGGLPDGTVDSGTIAADVASQAELDALVTGKVLQVVSATKTDTFSSSSTAWINIPSLSVTITPSSTSSKILVSYSLTGHSPHDAAVRLARDGTGISLGDGDGVRTVCTTEFPQPVRVNETDTVSSQFLDSPSSTAAIVYTVQCSSSGVLMLVNRSSTDSNAAGDSRTSSDITVMEIGA